VTLPFNRSTPSINILRNYSSWRSGSTDYMTQSIHNPPHTSPTSTFFSFQKKGLAQKAGSGERAESEPSKCRVPTKVPSQRPGEVQGECREVPSTKML
jgi:hypothetical protein